jgi:hypothetical protein
LSDTEPSDAGIVDGYLFNATGAKMIWLGLITLTIGAFIIQCLSFLFILQIPYLASVLAASLNVTLGLVTAGLAHLRRQPVESWLIYGAFAWPIALIHLFSIPAAKPEDGAAAPTKLQVPADGLTKATGQQVPRLP